jgi:hypothetical protein
MTTNSQRAILMVSMEPPATLEEEFNDWYDTEHFPQRRALAGFELAARWICIDGWPRWLALYELESTDALESAAYREVSGARSTPWSRRILPRTVGRTRVVARQLGEPQVPVQTAVRLLVAGIPIKHADAHSIASAIQESLAPRADVKQVRAFVEGECTLWLLVAFDAPVRAADLARQIGRPHGLGIETFNLYAPYVRSGYD